MVDKTIRTTGIFRNQNGDGNLKKFKNKNKKKEAKQAKEEYVDENRMYPKTIFNPHA